MGLLGREPAGEQAVAEIVVENVDLTAMSGISPRLGLGKGVDISINYVLNYPDYPARGDPSVHSDAVLMTRDFGTYSNLVAWNVIGLQSIQWRAT